MNALERFDRAGRVMDYIDQMWTSIEAPGFTGQRTACKEAVLQSAEETCGASLGASIRPYLDKRWAEVRALREQNKAAMDRIEAALAAIQ